MTTDVTIEASKCESPKISSPVTAVPELNLPASRADRVWILSQEVARTAGRVIGVRDCPSRRTGIVGVLIRAVLVLVVPVTHATALTATGLPTAGLLGVVLLSAPPLYVTLRSIALLGTAA